VVKLEDYEEEDEYPAEEMEFLSGMYDRTMSTITEGEIVTSCPFSAVYDGTYNAIEMYAAPSASMTPSRIVKNAISVIAASTTATPF